MLSVIMLSVIVLSVIMLNVIMLSVVMLNVAALGGCLKGKVQKTELFWINWKDTKIGSTINFLTQLRALGKLARFCYFL